MPSKPTHRKGHPKDQDENDTYKKFSCQRRPKHRECKGQWNSTHKKGRKGETEWMVKWAPCREDEAVQFVKEKYGHTCNPGPPNGNDPRPEKRHRKKTVSHMGILSYFAENVVPEYRPREMATHHPRAQAGDRHQNKHQRQQPQRMSSLEGARLLHDFKEATRASMPHNQARDPTVAAWVAEQAPPEAAITPSQDATPGRQHHRRRHHKSGHERRSEQDPPPPAAYPTNAPMPPVMPQQQFTTDPKHMSATNQGKMHAWTDDRPDWDVDDSNSDEDIAPPSCFAGGQTIFSTPAMPLRQHTTVEQQQMHNQNESESESESESGQIPQPQKMTVGIISPMGTAMPPMVPPAQDAHGGQQQMHPHHMPQYGQMSQPSATVPPPGALPMAPAVHTAPVMSSQHAPSDGKRHGHRRHHKSSHEPGAGPGQDPQPLSTISPGPPMPAGMVSPMGMTGHPEMPSTQYPPDVRQHQRHHRVASVVSYHEQAPLPSTAQPPHRTMRECMASMAEEAMLANPTQSIALRPGPPPPPECPLPWTQNPILRAESQAASRMPDPRDMQFPMAPPQAGTMTTAAADAPAPPHPQSTRKALRQGQPPPPPGMSSRASVAAASAAGTPGPQAIAVRPSPGALSGPPVMCSNLRRQPPPTSMPPFPGTCPPTPGSMDMARDPPPPVPTPPPLLGDDD